MATHTIQELSEKEMLGDFSSKMKLHEQHISFEYLIHTRTGSSFQKMYE